MFYLANDTVSPDDELYEGSHTAMPVQDDVDQTTPVEPPPPPSKPKTPWWMIAGAAVSGYLVYRVFIAPGGRR